MRVNGWLAVIVACLLVDLYIYLVHDSKLSEYRVAISPPAPLELQHAVPFSSPPLPHPLHPPPSPPPPIASETQLPSTSVATAEPRALPPLAALRAAAGQLSARCDLVVATAVFEGTQLLRQPRHCKSRAAQSEHRRAQRRGDSAALCHVAFVDWQSERLLKQSHAAVRSKMLEALRSPEKP